MTKRQPSRWLDHQRNQAGSCPSSSSKEDTPMSCPDPSPSKTRAPLRFRWGVLMVFLILAVLATAAIWMLTPPSYRAVGAVFVESPIPKMPLEPERMPPPMELLDRFVANQAPRLKDEGLLQEVVQDAAIRQTQWWRSDRDGESRLEELKDDLAVRQLPQTNYLEVAFCTRDKRDAPVIVNTIIDRYLAKMTTQARIRAEVELSDYDKTERTMQEQLDSIRRKKQDFLTSKLGVAGASQGLNVVSEQYRTLAEKVTRLEADKLQYKAEYESLRGMKEEQIAISPEMRAAIQQDPLIAKLQELKLMEELEVEAARATMPATRPADPANEARLKAIDRKLAELTAAREKEARQWMIRSAQTAYLNATQAELQLRERLLDAEAKQRDLDRSMAQFHSLEQEEKLFEDQLTRLRDYTNQLRMIVSASGGVRVQRGSMAYEPEKEEHGRQLVLTGLAFGVALLLGVPLSFTRSPRREEPESSDGLDLEDAED
jgi:uncharacterized protein involved in exopolysaccharide biosynthesis